MPNMKKDYQPVEREVFHVHTWRCKHAGETQDYEYVDQAIALGAKRIVFTDHCPFPGNPFGYRMDMEQLPEYVESIRKLGEMYADRIEVLCGLEVEYLPSYHQYYQTLHESGDFDLLILGQHFFEYPDGRLDMHDKDRTNAYIGLCDATVEGIKTGFFDVVAHPDRVFRKKESFDELAQESADKVIRAALQHNMYMEKNTSSMREEHYYWQEFWDMVPKEGKILYGLDAHSTKEMADGVSILIQKEVFYAL